jgi:hypothetical protein
MTDHSDKRTVTFDGTAAMARELGMSPLKIYAMKDDDSLEYQEAAILKIEIHKGDTLILDDNGKAKGVVS